MICTKEEMIQRVKDCGYELIERADGIVNAFEYGTDLTITCYINECDNGECPQITVNRELIPERFIKRLNDMENA